MIIISILPLKNTDNVGAVNSPQATPSAALGGTLGMHIFHHKTRHWYFWGIEKSGDRQEFIAGLINDACPKDDLDLTVGSENTLCPIDILQVLHAHFGVVFGNKPEAGHALSGADQIATSAHSFEDFLGTFSGLS